MERSRPFRGFIARFLIYGTVKTVPYIVITFNNPRGVEGATPYNSGVILLPL